MQLTNFHIVVTELSVNRSVEQRESLSHIVKIPTVYTILPVDLRA